MKNGYSILIRKKRYNKLFHYFFVKKNLHGAVVVDTISAFGADGAKNKNINKKTL